MEMVSIEALSDLVSPFATFFFFTGTLVGTCFGCYLVLLVDAIFLRVKRNKRKEDE